MRIVPYWTRCPPAVGLSLQLTPKTKTQKCYFSLPYNGIAVNIFLASQMAMRWAKEGKDWADTEDANKFFGLLQRSAQEAFEKFKVDHNIAEDVN